MDNTQDIPHEEVKEAGPEIIVLKFADSKIPVFKEARNKDYIKYGEDNRYPEYLTYLFDKSGKHNAIITGKANYIFGDGFENGDFIINRLGESLNDVSKKIILDTEIYGGFRLEIIYNMMGKISEIYHVDYSTLRTGKRGGFYWKESWDPLKDRQPEEFMPAFDISQPFGSQIYAYNEYRPMVRFYPLPSYIGCNNYVETDIEISKYYLSAIRNGMMPSKMVQFYQGEPTEDKKKQIEQRFAKKFTGAENAGRMILVFNSAKDKQVDIQDLSASEVDKQFVELNKTCQQEIYAGHRVTSPMLFGIKTEGQLGGNTELATSYTIFQNTYSKPRAKTISKEIQYVLQYSLFQGAYDLKPSDPIGAQFDLKDVVNALPKAFVFTALGVPKEMWSLENIGADNRATPTTPIAPAKQLSGPGVVAPAEAAAVNDNLKNLTAKQHQQVMRIIREYTKGKMTEVAAKTMLRGGLGLTDKDINDLLGIEPAAAAAFQEDEDRIIAMFDACGEARADFRIIKTKRISFSHYLEAEADEEVFVQEAFRTFDVTATENAILELIKKDKRITPDLIATSIGQSKAYVEAKIDSLTKKGYLESTTAMDGADEIVERMVPSDLDLKAPPPADSIPPSQISIKYSYEGPQDGRNRPFCAKMMALNRLYSRAEIEQISQRLGYSVFDRRGGFWTRKGTHDTTPYCRHKWKSNIVVKKGGSN